MAQQIIIFDTTLRDGEQVPGAKLNTIEKVEIAKQLEILGVDVIEAGFPISSPEDFESVKQVAATIKNAQVCALARGIDQDIDAAAEAIKNAIHPRIHTFVSASNIHLKNQMNKNQNEVLKMVRRAVSRAKKYSENVEFSPMDASRADFEYLVELINVAIAAGATTINIPDTVGYAVPEEWGKMIRNLNKAIPAFQKNIIMSMHTHNDLGLATANAIAGIENGARQIEATINGLGERAGNCALEEIAMILQCRYSKKYHTNINTQEIYKTSRLVSQIMGIIVQPNKAIVGANAFAHSSGIHQDAIIKNRENFEIINPTDVGISQSGIALTARSGRGALVSKLRSIGLNFDKKSVDAFYIDFLKVADRKKELNETELKLIIAGFTEELLNDKYKLDLVQVMIGNKNIPAAAIRIIDTENNQKFESTQTGRGGVEAIYKAITTSLNINATLKEFLVQAISEGSDSKGKVNIRVKINERESYGFGVDDDIIIASSQAYIDAINKHFLEEKSLNLDAEVKRITSITIAQTNQDNIIGNNTSAFKGGRAIISQILSEFPKQKALNVLFLGSGNGEEISQIYASSNRNIQNDKIYAIERRYDAVYQMQNNLPEITTIRGDYNNINLKFPNKLDLVICAFNEHDNSLINRKRLHHRIYSSLKTNGKFVIADLFVKQGVNFSHRKYSKTPVIQIKKIYSNLISDLKKSTDASSSVITELIDNLQNVSLQEALKAKDGRESIVAPEILKGWLEQAKFQEVTYLPNKINDISGVVFGVKKLL